MENKINIAQLLKDCPQGMELDCILYDNIYFDTVEHNSIKCYIQNKGYRTSVTFDVYGGLIDSIPTKCVIFPKGKTTWKGFQRPFKEGDIVVYDNPHRNNLQVFIFKNKEENNALSTCYLMLDGDELDLEEGMYYITRLATEEEKQKLFNVIKANGYKWNEETKTLEKLPKFEVGNRIILKDNPYNIPSIRIKAVTKSQYMLENGSFLYLDSTDKKYVLEDKFNITTFKPFDKVLVRDNSLNNWHIQFFEKYSKNCIYPFICMGYGKYKQCIPYENNEHLLDTTNDCNDYYKTWE